MILKELRLKKGLLQREVASKLGIASTTYLYYEKEEHDPSPTMLCKIADFFEVSVDELLGRNHDQELFDDARVPKTELQEIYDRLTPHQQDLVMERVRAFDDANAERAAQKSRTGKTVVIPVRTTDETYE